LAQAVEVLEGVGVAFEIALFEEVADAEFELGGVAEVVVAFAAFFEGGGDAVGFFVIGAGCGSQP
jgi:hypothetical protein